MKRTTRHFPCSSKTSVVSLSESRGGLKFYGVIRAKRYRRVSLNGKHNFNRKQTRLYTELQQRSALTAQQFDQIKTFYFDTK